METHQTEWGDNLWSQSKSLLLHHKKRITGFLILIMQGLKRIYVAYIFWLQLNRSSDSIIKKANQRWGIVWNQRTYSGAPIWVPSLRRRELGSIEPHKRREGLRHPVGDHCHGAEHDADLQQRHCHLCALLGDFIQTVFILQTPVRYKGDKSCCPERLAVSPGTPARMRFFWTSSTEAPANESDARGMTETGGSEWR